MNIEEKLELLLLRQEIRAYNLKESNTTFHNIKSMIDRERVLSSKFRNLYAITTPSKEV